MYSKAKCISPIKSMSEIAILYQTYSEDRTKGLPSSTCENVSGLTKDPCLSPRHVTRNTFQATRRLGGTRVEVQRCANHTPTEVQRNAWPDPRHSRKSGSHGVDQTRADNRPANQIAIDQLVHVRSPVRYDPTTRIFFGIRLIQKSIFDKLLLHPKCSKAHWLNFLSGPASGFKPM